MSNNTIKLTDSITVEELEEMIKRAIETSKETKEESKLAERVLEISKETGLDMMNESLFEIVFKAIVERSKEILLLIIGSILNFILQNFLLILLVATVLFIAFIYFKVKLYIRKHAHSKVS